MNVQLHLLGGNQEHAVVYWCYGIRARVHHQGVDARTHLDCNAGVVVITVSGQLHAQLGTQQNAAAVELDQMVIVGRLIRQRVVVLNAQPTVKITQRHPHQCIDIALLNTGSGHDIQKLIESPTKSQGGVNRTTGHHQTVLTPRNQLAIRNSAAVEQCDQFVGAVRFNPRSIPAQVSTGSLYILKTAAGKVVTSIGVCVGFEVMLVETIFVDLLTSAGE